MDFFIRPVLSDDAEDIWELRRMSGVLENIMAIPSETLETNISRLENIEKSRHQMAAVVPLDDGGEKCIGTAGLTVLSGRRRHVGEIGIMVSADYHGMGVGRALMESLVDIADNWLGLVRLELTVFCDNARAVEMYKTLGFEIEGTMKKAAVKNGKYADMYMMGRIRGQDLGIRD